MSYNDIISSGLLEQYAMGLLTEDESKTLESYFQQYPDLKKELTKIEEALTEFAMSQGMVPPAGTKEKILNNIRNTTSNSIQFNTSNNTLRPNSSKSWIDYLSAISIAALMVLGYNHFLLNKELSILKKDLIACDSIKVKNDLENEKFMNISNPSNNIVAFDPTPDFKETKLYLVQDPNHKKNFIQMVGVPALKDNETLQLWSLKSGADPMPLETFKKDNSIFVEVSFEDGTNAYAVTIEPAGGSVTPNLKKLIGVAKV